MSFGGASASTLDHFDSIDVPRTTRQARLAIAPKREAAASTVDDDLLPPEASPAGSSIDAVLVTARTYSVESDRAEFKTWREREGATALLEVIAHELARHVGSARVVATLQTEIEDPTSKHAILVAYVSPDRTDGMACLFGFTSSPWWLGIVRRMRNAIVVDIAYA